MWRSHLCGWSERLALAADHARSRWELRVCSRASDEAVGNDADRVEFRFRDANNRLDLKCARTSVPGTWLTVSHISRPTLIDTIRNVRTQRARVEGLEQTEQFAQLAAIHQDWWYARVATSPEEVGARVEFVGDLEIEVRDRTSRELDLRSFSQSQPGTGGHFVDEDRDLARRDRRFARSSSQLTPELFANMVESRWFNESTATIEEVDQSEGRLGQVTTPVPRSEPYQSQAAVHEEQTVEGFLQAPASQPAALAPKQL